MTVHIVCFCKTLRSRVLACTCVSRREVAHTACELVWIGAGILVKCFRFNVNLNAKTCLINPTQSSSLTSSTKLSAGNAIFFNTSPTGIA